MGEKQKITLGFAENFALSGAAAVISKTAAAPIERVKLLVQNQDEMLKTGRLATPYKGVVDCTVRTYRTEGTYIILDDNKFCFKMESDQIILPHFENGNKQMCILVSM